jgi:hypothetical protein
VASTQGPVRRKVSSSSFGPTESSRSLKQSLVREKKESKSTYPELGLPFWQSNWFLALLLIMAAGFFALAIFLYLGIELPNGSPSSAMAAEGVDVRSRILFFRFSNTLKFIIGIYRPQGYYG